MGCAEHSLAREMAVVLTALTCGLTSCCCSFRKLESMPYPGWGVLYREMPEIDAEQQ